MEPKLLDRMDITVYVVDTSRAVLDAQHFDQAHTLACTQPDRGQVAVWHDIDK